MHPLAAIAATISSETPLIVPIGAAVTVAGGLILAVWRLANFVRDLRESLDATRAAIAETWSMRDQEKWALSLERENRARGISLYVPDVTRADRST